MLKLLIIADDFTGALDTGVQLSKKGIRTKVVTDTLLTPKMIQDTDVLVIDSETRHKSPKEAAGIVAAITEQAVQLGTEYFYKKTDSALRGNIGAELEAMLRASGQNVMAFLPAFPKMRRLTVNGIQYIDGIPVAESVFAADPFNPVSHSSLKDIIQEQSEIGIMNESGRNPSGCDNEPCIRILDAESQEDLRQAGLTCMREQIRVYAGCAGFAEELPDLLLPGSDRFEAYNLGTKMTVICGSVNPISVSQVQYAAERGFRYISLSPEQKLAKNVVSGPEEKQFFDYLKQELKFNSFVIIDSNDENRKDTLIFAQKNGFSVEEMRDRIADNLGKMIVELYRSADVGILLIIGGDTLQKCMKELGITEIIPYSELYPGVVLSEFRYQNDTHFIITKSGGFGDPALLTEIARQYVGGQEYE